MHLACTNYLTHTHTGDRSAEAIDAGQVLPGYSGVIVRDRYAGYRHLTDALHPWCGPHLLRHLKVLYRFEPQQQEWASRMAALLTGARDAAAAARLAAQPALEPAALDDLLTRYRALTGAGLTANLYRRTATAKDARRPARRFRAFEDLILRSPPALTPTSSPTTKRSAPSSWRRSSSEAGGAWHTHDRLADFAVAESHPPTAANGAPPNPAPSATCSRATLEPPGLTCPATLYPQPNRTSQVRPAANWPLSCVIHPEASVRVR